MQRGKETTTMPPKNLISHVPGFENTISSETTSAQKGPKNSKCDEESARRNSSSSSHPNSSTTAPTKSEGTVEGHSSSGRERLRRHRVEVAGQVWIPEMWGQEAFLKDWIDSTALDAKLANSSIMSARVSLAEEGRRANSNNFTIGNSC